MNTLTAWFTKNPVAANLLALLVLVGGLFTMMGMRIEGFPKLPPSYINVTITYPGANASQVDDGVSKRVEKAIEGMPGIKKVVSLSYENSSQILIQKESEYDFVKLMNDVKTKVEGISQFPEKAEKPVITVDEFKDSVLIVQLYGDIDDRTLQESSNILERELQADPNISKIETFGRKTPELRIELDEAKMKAYGISISDLNDLITANNLNYGFGSLKSMNGYISLRADSKLHDVDKLKLLPVYFSADGSVIYLKNIASIVDSYNETSTSARFQGQKSVGIMIYTSSKGDMLEVSKSAHRVVAKLSEQLPETIHIDIWADFSNYMKNRILLLQSNAWQGLLIVFVILAIFLDIKLAFWVAMGIPFSVAGAFAIMGDRFLGYTINDITTFGMIIVLGMLVDDAVVVGESVYEERLTTKDPIAGTIKGVNKVAVATIFGVATSIAAFYPIMLLKNDLGKLFASFSGVVITALVFSLIESKLVLPAHLASINISQDKKRGHINRIYSFIQDFASRLLTNVNNKVYKPALKVSLRYKYSVLVIFLTVAFSGILIVERGYVRNVFFPDIPSDVVIVSATMEKGSSDYMTIKNTDLLERAAEKTNHEFMNIYNTTNKPMAKIMSSYEGGEKIELYAELQPQDKRVVETNELIKRWRENAQNLEGVESLSFDASTETGGGFIIKVESRNGDSLEKAVSEISKSLSKIEGVYDIKNDLKTGKSEIQIVLKPEARSLCATSESIAKYIDTVYGGLEFDRFHNDTDEVKLKMINNKDSRQYISQLMESDIALPDGSLVKIKDVAKINFDYAPGYIRRENGKRSIEISANLDKRFISPETVFSKLDTVIDKTVKEMPDVEVSQGGELEEETEMKAGLVKALVMVVLMIYALLAIPLKSYWMPFVIMSVIPFGFIGAIAGHYMMGLPISVLSLFGMLALAGIVVNNSLVMLTRYNDLIDEGVNMDDALIEAGTSRFRAILLTTATTVCGLIPLMSAKSEQAQYLIPAAVSLAYGLLFATVITLVIVPLAISASFDLRNVLKR